MRWHAIDTGSRSQAGARPAPSPAPLHLLPPAHLCGLSSLLSLPLDLLLPGRERLAQLAHQRAQRRRVQRCLLPFYCCSCASGRRSRRCTACAVC